MTAEQRERRRERDRKRYAARRDSQAVHGRCPAQNRERIRTHREEQNDALRNEIQSHMVSIASKDVYDASARQQRQQESRTVLRNEVNSQMLSIASDDITVGQPTTEIDRYLNRRARERDRQR